MEDFFAAVPSIPDFKFLANSPKQPREVNSKIIHWQVETDGSVSKYSTFSIAFAERLSAPEKMEPSGLRLLLISNSLVHFVRNSFRKYISTCMLSFLITAVNTRPVSLETERDVFRLRMQHFEDSR